MPYATLSDLVARFGEDELLQLTDRDGSRQVDGAAVASAIADADAMIETYLAQRYALPVTPVPSLLRRLSCDMARHLLHGNAATEAVRRAHEEALRTLRDLADGRAALPGAAPAAAGQTPATGGGAPRVTAPDRIFGRAQIGDFLG